jgi:hypothetical protein
VRVLKTGDHTVLGVPEPAASVLENLLARPSEMARRELFLMPEHPN